MKRFLFVSMSVFVLFTWITINTGEPRRSLWQTAGSIAKNSVGLGVSAAVVYNSGKDDLFRAAVGTIGAGWFGFRLLTDVLPGQFAKSPVTDTLLLGTNICLLASQNSITSPYIDHTLSAIKSYYTHFNNTHNFGKSTPAMFGWLASTSIASHFKNKDGAYILKTAIGIITPLGMMYDVYKDRKNSANKPLEDERGEGENNNSPYSYKRFHGEAENNQKEAENNQKPVDDTKKSQTTPQEGPTDSSGEKVKFKFTFLSKNASDLKEVMSYTVDKKDIMSQTEGVIARFKQNIRKQKNLLDQDEVNIFCAGQHVNCDFLQNPDVLNYPDLREFNVSISCAHWDTCRTAFMKYRKKLLTLSEMEKDYIKDQLTEDERFIMNEAVDYVHIFDKLRDEFGQMSLKDREAKVKRIEKTMDTINSMIETLQKQKENVENNNKNDHNSPSLPNNNIADPTINPNNVLYYLATSNPNWSQLNTTANPANDDPETKKNSQGKRLSKYRRHRQRQKPRKQNITNNNSINDAKKFPNRKDRRKTIQKASKNKPYNNQLNTELASDEGFHFIPGNSNQASSTFIENTNTSISDNNQLPATSKTVSTSRDPKIEGAADDTKRNFTISVMDSLNRAYSFEASKNDLLEHGLRYIKEIVINKKELPSNYDKNLIQIYYLQGNNLTDNQLSNILKNDDWYTQISNIKAHFDCKTTDQQNQKKEAGKITSSGVVVTSKNNNNTPYTPNTGKRIPRRNKNKNQKKTS